MTTFIKVRPMLEAIDVATTVAFYTDVLGFTLGDTIDAEGGGWAWASLKREDVEMMFIARHSHEVDDEHDHDHAHPDLPVMTGTIYINVDDVDAMTAELSGKVELGFGPETMSYGMREIGFTDPNGYWLVLGAPVD